jgi:hypothetical protein
VTEQDGSSALIEAVYANKIDCLRVLLDAGADTEIAIPVRASAETDFNPTYAVLLF